MNVKKTVATVGATAVLAAPLTVLSAAPAQAADREFRVGGAEVEFEVERAGKRRYKVEVEIDDARPGSRWRVVLRHNGKRFHKNVHRARDGEVEIEKRRPNTRGRDRFRVVVKKIGGPRKARVIRMR